MKNKKTIPIPMDSKLRDLLKKRIEQIAEDQLMVVKKQLESAISDALSSKRKKKTK